MPPSVLIELGLTSLRQPRGFACGRRVTARAGHAGGATVAGEGAIAPGATGMLFANPAAILALGAFHRSLRSSLRSFSAFCMSIRCSRTVGTWYPSSRARRRTICIFLLRAAAIRGADAPDATKSRSRSSCSCVQIMLGLSNKWGHGRCGGPATVPLPVHAPGRGARQINALAGISVPKV